MALSSKQHIARFNAGCLGFMIVVLVPAIGIFVVAIFSEALLADLASDYHGRWFRWMQPFTVGGVNIAVGLFTLVLMYETWRTLRRIVNPIAVKATADGLAFHSSVKRHNTLWPDIKQVEHWENSLIADLIFTFEDGKRLRIKQINKDEAKAFADYCSAKLGFEG